MTPSKRRRTSATISTRRGGDGAAVGIAEAEDVGAGLMGGLQGAQGVIGIGGVAIEEVLGVVDDFLAVILDVADGFGDEDEVFFVGDAERAFDVKVPGLAEDGDDGSAGFDQGADVAVFVHGILGEAGAAEGGELGVVQVEFGGALEELLVLGVAAGPAALNVINTELVQLLGNDELVVHGERDGLALRAVPESGVEGMDFHKGSSEMDRPGGLSYATGTPTSFFFLRNGIMSRRLLPTVSIWSFGRLRAWRGTCGGRICSRRSTVWRIRRTGFRRGSSSFRRGSDR